MRHHATLNNTTWISLLTLLTSFCFILFFCSDHSLCLSLDGWNEVDEEGDIHFYTRLSHANHSFSLFLCPLFLSWRAKRLPRES